jgi:DNA-binding GntR family transcriptional regulator
VRYLYRGTYARAAAHPHIRLIHAREQRDGPTARQAVVQDLQSACLHILRKIAKDDGLAFPQEWEVAGLG